MEIQPILYPKAANAGKTMTRAKTPFDGLRVVRQSNHKACQVWRNRKLFYFAPWGPFDGVYPEPFGYAQDRLRRRAQDMLGAINFVEVVLLKI